jgi:hypothetical protein
MATRFLGPTGSRRRRRFLLFAPLVAVAAMVIAMSASGGLIGTAAGFEDDDGNLAPNPSGINFDWNSFAPTTWTGTAPTRDSTKSVGLWTFNGKEDWQATGADSAFPGGTKQDNECPNVITAKAPNKDDLKRIYLASETAANGHVYLMLSWVRIPQNTTSASAHVAFEFNQGTSACPAGSDGLVHRTDGDMLIVYDFEGGAGAPVIKLERWTTDPADPCEVGSNSPPCWGPASDLTASGFAEAKVNTGVSVSDAIAPSPPENLGDSEFGEAGIDLTGAGVFNQNVCTGFGKAYGVSRSSGQSSTAQMKDLVGPLNINISNCGRVIIRKVTVPSPDPTDSTFSYSTTGTDLSAFTLKNGGSKDFGSSVHAGSKTVTEADPGVNFVLTSIDCSASSTTHGSTFSTDTGTRTATFTLAAQDTIDCTFTNTLQTGAIKVTKTRKHAADGPGDHPHAGVTFTVNGVSKVTDANGVACFDGLVLNQTYTVHETVPSGYHGEADKQVLVDNAATCSGNPYGGESVSFHNTPLTDITTSVNSQIDGGTASTITCVDSDGNTVASGSTGANGDGSATASDLEPDTYTCTVVVDP